MSSLRMKHQEYFFSGGIANLSLVTFENGETATLRQIKWGKSWKLHAREQFITGIKIRKELGACAYIVSTLEYHAFCFRPYELLEYIPGNSLKWLIAKRPYFVRNNYKKIVMDAALGLAHVHKKGYMHLDIKPENYIINYNDDYILDVKLTDFDLARHADVNNAKMAGTPTYMAPEQVVQKVSYQTSDVFAFGIMAYFIISGEMPFTGDTPLRLLRNQCRENVLAVPLDECVKDVDKKWSNAVMRCLAKNSSQRYPTIEGFLNDIAQ